ncbi:TRAP transporter large permease [Marinobacterium iners]|uniref:TRAP transporter large permease protein n=1 Tax=Marinobacterium iners DSM 11526 TaxID=1122198 RepID=A0A1H3X2V5_9GAMM|nr:TRAP transporter large permease [Marinobacterium iners]SDZ92962.1 TRAP transporter, DctM subunit [Marinobacterium iners DSM 11526]
MEWYYVLSCMFLGVIFLLLAGVPVVFSFLTMNILGSFFIMGGDIGIQQMVRNMQSSVANFSLVPIVLFVLMGEILLQSGVAKKAIDSIDKLLAKTPGRLSVVAIIGGTIFSSLSGSTMANTAILGKTLMPEMKARGYSPSISMGPIMAVGGIAMLIPPSALAVLLGSMGKISINSLLIASIIPALIICFLFFTYVFVRCKLNEKVAPAYEIEIVSFGERIKPFIVHVAPLIAIFAVVVGSMIGGIATPTESAALGCVASLIMTVIYKKFTARGFYKSVKETLIFSSMILFVICASSSFSQILGFSGATQKLSALVAGSGMEASYILILMLLVMLVLGFFMDQVSIMMLTLPIFIPIVTILGADPVWFGVMTLIVLEVGLCTPPFGLLLFVMQGVVPTENIKNIYKAVIPYVAIEVGVIVLIFMYPSIVELLPSILLQ